MSPYFKISTMDFSNLVSPEVFMENIYGNAIICDKKPKCRTSFVIYRTIESQLFGCERENYYDSAACNVMSSPFFVPGTSKDLQTLKNKIWEVVIEKEYGELQNRFNYLQSMTSFKQSQLENEVESSEGSSSRKESDRPSFRKNRRRGAIEIKEKETSIPLTRSFEVPTSTGNLRISARIDMSTKSLQQWFQQEEAALRSSSLETLLLKNTASADNIDWSKVAAEVVSYRTENFISVKYSQKRLVYLDTERRLPSAARSERRRIVNLFGTIACTLLYLRSAGLPRN